MKFAASLALAAALLSSVCSAGYNGKPYAKKADKESFHLKPGSCQSAPRSACCAY
jgi:hypothetical protein